MNNTRFHIYGYGKRSWYGYIYLDRTMRRYIYFVPWGLTDGCVPHLHHFLCLFLPFFFAGGKARVIQSRLRLAKSRRKSQSSSNNWSEKMVLSTTKVLIMTGALSLPSNRRPTVVSNELVPWLKEGQKGGNCTVLCLHKYNQKHTLLHMPLRANHVHTQSFCRTPYRMQFPYLYPYKRTRAFRCV